MNINVPLRQEGNSADITYTVFNSSGKYLNGVQLQYVSSASTMTIFTASTIAHGEQRSGHAIIPKGTIKWTVSSYPMVSVMPSSGSYKDGDKIVFTLVAN